MISKTFLKLHASLLIVILAASFFLVINPIPVKAQRIRIIDVDNPSQVRVGENFRCDIEIFYEAEGPVTLDAQINVLDVDTGETVGETSFGPEIPEGEIRSTTTFLKNTLTAPDSPMIWNLRAELAGGNDLPFSIEVVSDDSPPLVRIVGLEATPASLQMGDEARITCTVDYSIPDGSFFEIRFTTSHGDPVLYGLGDGFMALDVPGVIAPEGAPIDIEEISRAGEDSGGMTPAPNSGTHHYWTIANAPLESGNWIWHFRIMYHGPEGVERGMGRREITVEVSTRTEPWVVIDLVYPGEAAPGLGYNVEVRGRYFFPDEDDHEIRIDIFDLDTDGIAPGDSRHDIPISERSSGILLEDFIPTAPMDEFRVLNLTAMVYQRTGPPMSFELEDEMPFVVFRSSGPVDPLYIEIDHIGTAPEVEYGNPVDLGVRVNYVFPPDEDTEFNIDIWQIGGLFPLASDRFIGRGDDWQLVELSIPPERVPPRNGEWRLEAWASAMRTYHVYRFDLNVIGADEGISGGSSDWMLLDGWPSNPMAIEGEEMLFWAVIGVETTDDLPQQVWLTLEIDGTEIVREAVTYLDGLIQLDFRSLSPWIATPGSHTAVWTVDPDEDYVDPDRDNNQLEFTFEVAEAMPLPSDGVIPGEEPPEPEEEFNFYVTANPTEGTLASSESYSISVELVSGESQLVQLALVGVPAGLSYSFNPSAGEPSYDSILTVTGSDSLPAGTYSLIINATDGVRVRYKPIILNVEEGADYELSISPSSIIGKPGDIVEFTISVTSDSGYNQLVNLVVSGVPGGVASRLEPSAEEPDFQSFLILEVGLVPGEVAAVGIHDFFVTGSGIEPRQVHSTLIIEEGDEDGTVREDGRRNLSYYLPLVYLIAILAAMVGGATYGIKRLRKPKKAKVFCIECGKKIPADAKKCPKCDVKQEE